jgi:hypothetical protein
MNVAESKAPETYYSKNLNDITVFSYVGLMLTIFLSFGFIRSKRKDQKKVRGQDKLEEMMESFGLKDLSKEQLLTITKSFNTKLRTTSVDRIEEEPPK